MDWLLLSTKHVRTFILRPVVIDHGMLLYGRWREELLGASINTDGNHPRETIAVTLRVDKC